MSNHRTPSDTPLVIAGTVLVLAVLAVYVVLTLRGFTDATGQVLAFVTPLVAALLIARRVDAATAPQNEVLAKIQRQTNGVLDERIRAGVHAALVQLPPRQRPEPFDLDDVTGPPAPPSLPAPPTETS